MGLFKKLVGDIAKTVGESLEDVSNEAKKSFQEASEEIKKSIQEAKMNQLNSDDSDDSDDDDDDDDDIRIQLGTFKNGVLTIAEGHTTLGEDSLEGYKKIRKVVFPSTLKEIDGCFFSEHGHEDYLEEVDFSKVKLLKEIPDCLFENCKRLQEINFPEGVEIIDSEVFDGCTNLRKITFPSTLKSLQSTTYKCENIEELDLSKVHLLKEIPDCLFEDCERLQEISFPEGVETIGSEVFDSCTNLRKITFPSTLKSLQSTTYKCKNIEELDLSKVHLLKEIPDNFISENCKIETLVIPVGVKIVGDEFASSKSIREVYVPYTVEEIGTLNNEEYAPDVYIYTNKLTDIESLCAYIKTLYVPEELYVYYAELLKDVDDTEVRLRKMPADKLDFYGTPVPSLTEVDEEDNSAPQLPEQDQDIETPIVEEETEDIQEEAEEIQEETEEIQDETEEIQEETEEIQEETEEIPTIQKSPGNLFSDGLEELINSVAESDELTDKKKEIVLRRAVKEGEDPDEVEMVLEARFYEKHN